MGKYVKASSGTIASRHTASDHYYYNILAAYLYGTCPDELSAAFGLSMRVAASGMRVTSPSSAAPADRTTGPAIDTTNPVGSTEVPVRSTEIPVGSTEVPVRTADLLAFARARKLSVHRFKQSALLPRVKTVIGILKGLYPDELLDIGTGRGVFIWPLLNELPDLKTVCIDLNSRHIKVLSAVSSGGYPNIQARTMDATCIQYPENSFHTITMLEVLEHIPDYRQAAVELLRVARRFIVISVPSKPDTNPEHINLFTKKDIMNLFGRPPVKNIRFSTVPNHMIAVVSL